MADAIIILFINLALAQGIVNFLRFKIQKVHLDCQDKKEETDGSEMLIVLEKLINLCNFITGVGI